MLEMNTKGSMVSFKTCGKDHTGSQHTEDRMPSCFQKWMAKIAPEALPLLKTKDQDLCHHDCIYHVMFIGV